MHKYDILFDILYWPIEISKQRLVCDGFSIWLHTLKQLNQSHVLSIDLVHYFAMHIAHCAAVIL